MSKQRFWGTLGIVFLVMLAASAQRLIESLDIGGGYGDTGISLQGDGDLLMDGDLTVDGTIYGDISAEVTSATITGQDLVGLASGDQILITDGSDGDALKRGDIGDLIVEHTGDVTGTTALTIANGAVDIAHLSATGTADATTVLYGDNTWGVPAGGGDMLLSGTQTVTGITTFENGSLKLDGSTSGSTTLNAPAVANNAEITFPDATGTLALTTDITVTSVNGSTGNVSVNADDIDDAATTNRFVTEADLTKLGNLSGTNTGDQTITLTGDVTGTGTGSFATSIASAVVGVDELSATGTTNSTTFLRGDNTWALPPVTATNTATLTNKRITKRLVTLTDAGTVLVNTDTIDIATLTLSGNRTLGADSGSPTDGQILLLRVTQDGTGSRTLAYTSASGGWAFTADLAEPTLSTVAGAIDYLLWIYHSGDDRWHLLAINKGA